MDPHKTGRLNHAILKTLSDLLELEVNDPRVGFVTLNGVDLNRDHSVAKVFFSVLGDDGDRQRSLAGLRKARGFLQGKLSRTLRLRQTPELRFVYDESLDRGLDLQDTLRELAERGEFVSAEERRRQLTLEDLQPNPELLRALAQGDDLWIVPHWNPDPDAMGSALALAAALGAVGKKVTVLAYPQPPIGVVDLPGYSRTIPADEAEALFRVQPPDTLVLVDCHRRDRCGPLEDLLNRIDNAWAVDHHLFTGRRTPLPGWIEPKACSCCTLVYRVIQELAAGGHLDRPLALNLEMATNLYAGLMNDTGGFRFPNTTPMTFELARRLAAAGVNTTEVARLTLHRFRREGVELMQKVLASYRYHAGGRILVLRADRQMLAESGALMADTEGLVNVATAVEGVQFVAFLKELEPDLWRISLRSPGGGDVQVVAARYGGGGHRQAAGCTIAGPGDEVAEKLVGDLAAHLPDSMA